MGALRSMCRPFALILATQPRSPVYRAAGKPNGSDGEPPGKTVLTLKQDLAYRLRMNVGNYSDIFFIKMRNLYNDFNLFSYEILSVTLL